MTQAAPAMSQDFQELRQWLTERHGQYQSLYKTIRQTVHSKKSSKLVTDTPDAIMAIVKQNMPQATPSQILEVQKYIIGHCVIDNAPPLLDRYRHPGVHTALLKNFLRIEASIFDENAKYDDYDFFIKDIIHAYGECIPCLSLIHI